MTFVIEEQPAQSTDVLITRLRIENLNLLLEGRRFDGEWCLIAWIAKAGCLVVNRVGAGALGLSI